MSEENVEAFKRGVAAWNRGDIDAALAVLDPDVEVHAVAPAALGGESTIYRGHEGARELFRDVHEAFVEHRIEISEIGDLGERVLAVGQLRMRGTEAGPRSSRQSRTWTSSRTARSLGLTTSSTPKSPRCRRA